MICNQHFSCTTVNGACSALLPWLLRSQLLSDTVPFLCSVRSPHCWATVALHSALQPLNCSSTSSHECIISESRRTVIIVIECLRSPSLHKCATVRTPFFSRLCRYSARSLHRPCNRRSTQNNADRAAPLSNGRWACIALGRANVTWLTNCLIVEV